MSTNTSVSDQVAQYFAANPNATPEQVAAAVQSVGGMTPDIASALASHYGTDASTITNDYSNLVASQPATSTSAAASTPAASTPSLSDLLNQYNSQTQQGIQNSGLGSVMTTVNSGGNIASIASQGLVPQAVASYQDASGNTITAPPNTYSVSSPDGSGGSLNYFFQVDPTTGATTPISNPSQNLTYTPGSGGGVLGGITSGITKALSNPLVDLAVNAALPGAGAYIAAAGAANNLANGNTTAGLVDAALAAYGFNQTGGNVSVNPAISNALSDTSTTSTPSTSTPSTSTPSTSTPSTSTPSTSTSSPYSLSGASSASTDVTDPMSPFYDANTAAAPTGSLAPTDYSLSPDTSSGTGLNALSDTSTASTPSTSTSSPYSLSGASSASTDVTDPMSPFYDPNAAAAPTGSLAPTDYSLNPGTSSGTGLNVQPGTGLDLFNTSTYDPTTGLTNGLGLQTSGTPNVDSMGGGQGLTTATPYGPLSESGVSVYGSGGLPINSLTGQTLGSQLATTTTGLETAQLPTVSTGLPVNTLTGQTLGGALSTVDTGVTALTPVVQTAIDTLANTALPSTTTGTTKTGTGTTNTTNNTTNNAASMSGLNPNVTSGTQDVIVGDTPYSVPLIPVFHKEGGSIRHYDQGGALPPVSLAPRLLQGNSAPVQGYLNQSTIPHPHTGLTKFEYRAEGGEVGEHTPEFFSEGGLNSLSNKYVTGRGDGTSDSIPAMLANGEFVIPADVVSNLGNGDNSSGAKVLDKFMQVIRHHKRDVAPDQLPPDSKGPLSYLAEAQKKVK